ncbi:MAG: hypothetical protein ACLQU2_28530 [Candidatus Binataceae bacterium]
MTDALEDLNNHLRAAEAQKQESITANLTGALRDLQNSISNTLGQLGERFTEALSASTRGQFEELAATVAGASELMRQMASQSQDTQNALAGVVELARRTTADQLAMGTNQIAELSTAMHRMMGQMREHSDASATGLSSALSSAVGEMSARIAELNDRLATSMTATAQQTSGQIQTLLQELAANSRSSAEALSAIIEQARNTTSEQLTTGKSQIADLTNHLEALMARLSHAAETSAAGVNSTMDGAVSQMATRMNELSEKLNGSITASAQSTNNAVRDVMEQAGG